MSKKAVKETGKFQHQKAPRADIPFKKMTPSELAEFNTRRAAGEDEAAIAADFKRRKRA
jgi:hypothetical protein